MRRAFALTKVFHWDITVLPISTHYCAVAILRNIERNLLNLKKLNEFITSQNELLLKPIASPVSKQRLIDFSEIQRRETNYEQ